MRVFDDLASISLLGVDPRDDPAGQTVVDTSGWHDLRLDALVEAITSDQRVADRLRSILRHPTTEEKRRDRRAVIDDFVASPELRSLADRIAPRLAEIRTDIDREQDRDLLKLVHRLSSLDLMLELLDDLCGTLIDLGSSLRAPSLGRLQSVFSRYRDDPDVSTLRKTLQSLRRGLRDRKSVTIGVNLDDRLRPVEAVLLSINETTYRNDNPLHTIGRTLFGNDDGYRTNGSIHTNNAPLDRPESTTVPLAPLFQDLDEILSGQSKRLARGLRRFAAVSTEVVVDIGRELVLAASIAAVVEKLQSAGYPTATERTSGDVIDLYDPVLALERIRTKGEPVVVNTIRKIDGVTPLVVTGPNNGGKTTVLRALGIALVLRQAGLFVPARSFDVEVPAVGDTVAPSMRTDNLAVVTHFSGGEGSELEGGRFAEEARRLAHTLADHPQNAVFLLNETFSSTHYTEAEELLVELIELLRDRGCWVVCTTHLYRVVDRLGDAARSLTIHPNDPYHLVDGRPDGHSLARSVARSVGLDFDALRRENGSEQA
jgi:DNA mismatch repair protein MutS